MAMLKVEDKRQCWRREWRETGGRQYKGEIHARKIGDDDGGGGEGMKRYSLAVQTVPLQNSNASSTHALLHCPVQHWGKRAHTQF